MAPAFFYFLYPELYAEKDSTAGDHPAVLPAYRKLISGLKVPGHL